MGFSRLADRYCWPYGGSLVRISSADARAKGEVFLDSAGNAEHVPVVSGYGFQFHFLRGVEWLSVIPGVECWRDHPEIALGITHNPSLGASLVHINANHPFFHGHHIPLPPAGAACRA